MSRAANLDKNNLDAALKTYGIVHYSSLAINKPDDNENEDTYKNIEDLINSLTDMDNTIEVSAKVNDYINKILKKSDSLPEIKETVLEYFSAIKLGFRKLKIKMDINIYGSFYPDIKKLKSKEDIKKWFLQKMEVLSSDFFYSTQNKIDYKFHQIFQYISRHKFNEISLKSAADTVGISPQYLSRYFKERYGQNFITYIKNSKFDFAKSLLLSSSEKISSISKKVGYWDYKYFCKIFKNHTGFTPTEYRSKFKVN